MPDYIPEGQCKGLLATFNGGFKLDTAGGGFYLNGIYHGKLVNGAASIVYYKNGTIKIGEWGRDFYDELLDRGRQAEPQAARGQGQDRPPTRTST